MIFSSNTYTFYYMLIVKCPWLSLSKIEDLRFNLHPQPVSASMIVSSRSTKRKTIKAFDSLEDLNVNEALKPKRRERSNSFCESIDLDNFK